MTFKTFSEAVHARYQGMAERELFVVDVEDIFDKYLNAFPEGTNPIFRVRTEHDCNCCKQFIRRLGILVAFDDYGNRLTVWDDFPTLVEPYGTVARTLANLVRQAPLKTVFRSKERTYGTAFNFDTETEKRWDHFHGTVANKHYTPDPATKRGEREAIHQVLKRGLTQIVDDDIATVIDLIEGNALYRGEEHLPAVKGFRDLQNAAAKFTANGGDLDTFVWMNLDDRNARFRNTVIGTLLVDLAEGKDLEQAVKSFETKVAPMNYKRPTALITPRMIDDAVAKLNALGLEGAVHRRMATINDVSVNDVLFVDNAVRGNMREGLAGLLDTAVKPRAVEVKNPEEVTMDFFLDTVLPTAKTVDLLLQNKQMGNFVTITGGDGPERLFKWNNNFAWSYDGEVTDSIKERVKSAGGNVTGDMRVSLGWHNGDDLDLHVRTPQGRHAFFGDKMGILDVDMNAGGVTNKTNPVENMAWSRIPMDGDYVFWVNQYSMRSRENVGFVLEVEFLGAVQRFTYDKLVTDDVRITLTIQNGRLAGIKHGTALVAGSASNEKWGLNTETLVPVDTVMLSPNHWDGAGAVGNKHLFFILKGCKNPDAVRGIYNEFLRSDLDQHRKVFEVLGAKTKCPPSDSQLSGLGFSSTKRDEATVVVDGRRAYTIRF